MNQDPQIRRTPDGSIDMTHYLGKGRDCLSQAARGLVARVCRAISRRPASDPIEHRLTLNKWDTFSCPPRVYRGFHNAGDTDAVRLTVITGVEEGRDDVSMPDSIAQEAGRNFGPKVADAFLSMFSFDPPRPSA